MWNRHLTHMVSMIQIPVLFLSCNGHNTEKMNSASNEQPIPIVENYRNDSLLPNEFIQWYSYEGNHLRQVIQSEQIQFTLEYRPAVYSALQEIRKEEIRKTELDSVVSNYEELMQFCLEIEIPGDQKEFLKNESPDGISYEDRVKYFAFELQQDISLVAEDDTIPCSMLHFERNYGVSPKATFLLGFVQQEIKGSFDILIREKVYTRQQLKFSFNKEDLTNLPQIKTL